MSYELGRFVWLCFHLYSPNYRLGNDKFSRQNFEKIRRTLCISHNKDSSKSAMNKMEQGESNLAPIVVPCFCLSTLSCNWKKLFFKATSANSKVSVICSLFSLFSTCFLTEGTPSSYGMLGYRQTISVVHRIAIFGKLPNSFSFLRK